MDATRVARRAMAHGPRCTAILKTFSTQREMRSSRYDDSYYQYPTTHPYIILVCDPSTRATCLVQIATLPYGARPRVCQLIRQASPHHCLGEKGMEPAKQPNLGSPMQVVLAPPVIAKLLGWWSKGSRCMTIRSPRIEVDYQTSLRCHEDRGLGL